MNNMEKERKNYTMRVYKQGKTGLMRVMFKSQYVVKEITETMRLTWLYKNITIKNN